MSKVLCYAKHLESHPQLCKNGPTMDTSNAYDYLGADNASTTKRPLNDSCNSDHKDRLVEHALSTPESHRNISDQTSNDKFKTSKQPTLTTNSSKISDPDLTIIDPDCKPFWNEFVKDISNKLQSCIGTDSAVTELKSWNGSSRRLTQNSWFTAKMKTFTNLLTTHKNSPKTSFLLSTSLWQDIMDAAALRIANEEEKKKTKKMEKQQNDQEKQQPPAQKRPREEVCDPSTYPNKKKKTESTTKEQAIFKRNFDEQPKGSQKQAKKRRREDTKEETENQRAKRIAKEKVELFRLENGVGRNGAQPKPSVKPVKDDKDTQTDTFQDKVSKPHAKSDQEKKPHIEFKVRNVRMFPTSKQRAILRKWFIGARWTYNRCVEIFKQYGTAGAKLNVMRQTTVNAGAHAGKPTEWVLGTPTEVREGAMRDVLKAIRSNFQKMRKAKDNSFELKFKDGKGSDSILISKKKCKLEAELLSAIKMEKHFKPNFDHDMRIVWKRSTGTFLLSVPVPIEQVCMDQAPHGSSPIDGVIALDPGVRTFMTGFDPSGKTFDWCAGDHAKLRRLQRHLRRLRRDIQSAEIRHRQRYRLRKAAARLEERIHNLVDEVHRKLTKWLCENYRVIFMPKFEISRMVQSKKMSADTKRGLYVWRFHEFRQRLLSKAREYPWVQVFIVNESYTSKTCTHCGWFHEKLGGAKEFMCDNCKSKHGRDEGGARNILLRQLGLLLKDRLNAEAALSRRLPLGPSEVTPSGVTEEDVLLFTQQKFEFIKNFEFK